MSSILYGIHKVKKVLSQVCTASCFVWTLNIISTLCCVQNKDDDGTTDPVPRDSLIGFVYFLRENSRMNEFGRDVDKVRKNERLAGE